MISKNYKVVAIRAEGNDKVSLELTTNLSGSSNFPMGAPGTTTLSGLTADETAEFNVHQLVTLTVEPTV